MSETSTPPDVVTLFSREPDGGIGSDEGEEEGGDVGKPMLPLVEEIEEEPESVTTPEIVSTVSHTETPEDSPVGEVEARRVQFDMTVKEAGREEPRVATPPVEGTPSNAALSSLLSDSLFYETGKVPEMPLLPLPFAKMPLVTTESGSIEDHDQHTPMTAMTVTTTSAGTPRWEELSGTELVERLAEDLGLGHGIGLEEKVTLLERLVGSQLQPPPPPPPPPLVVPVPPTPIPQTVVTSPTSSSFSHTQETTPTATDTAHPEVETDYEGEDSLTIQSVSTQEAVLPYTPQRNLRVTHQAQPVPSSPHHVPGKGLVVCCDMSGTMLQTTEPSAHATQKAEWMLRSRGVTTKTVTNPSRDTLGFMLDWVTAGAVPGDVLYLVVIGRPGGSGKDGLCLGLHSLMGKEEFQGVFAKVGKGVVMYILSDLSPAGAVSGLLPHTLVHTDTGRVEVVPPQGESTRWAPPGEGLVVVFAGSSPPGESPATTVGAIVEAVVEATAVASTPCIGTILATMKVSFDRAARKENCKGSTPVPYATSYHQIGAWKDKLWLGEAVAAPKYVPSTCRSISVVGELEEPSVIESSFTNNTRLIKTPSVSHQSRAGPPPRKQFWSVAQADTVHLPLEVSTTASTSSAASTSPTVTESDVVSISPLSSYAGDRSVSPPRPARRQYVPKRSFW